MAKTKAQVQAAKEKEWRLSNFSITPIRMSDETRTAIQAKADKYADGNLSAWLRYAGQYYAPEPKEDIPLEIV